MGAHQTDQLLVVSPTSTSWPSSSSPRRRRSPITQGLASDLGFR